MLTAEENVVVQRALDVMRKHQGLRDVKIAEAALELLLFRLQARKPTPLYTPKRRWEKQLVGNVLIRHQSIVPADRIVHDVAARLLGEKEWADDDVARV